MKILSLSLLLLHMSNESYFSIESIELPLYEYLFIFKKNKKKTQLKIKQILILNAQIIDYCALWITD